MVLIHLDHGHRGRTELYDLAALDVHDRLERLLGIGVGFDLLLGLEAPVAPVPQIDLHRRRRIARQRFRCDVGTEVQQAAVLGEADVAVGIGRVAARKSRTSEMGSDAGRRQGRRPHEQVGMRRGARIGTRVVEECQRVRIGREREVRAFRGPTRALSRRAARSRTLTPSVSWSSSRSRRPRTSSGEMPYSVTSAISTIAPESRFRSTRRAPVAFFLLSGVGEGEAVGDAAAIGLGFVAGEGSAEGAGLAASFAGSGFSSRYAIQCAELVASLRLFTRSTLLATPLDRSRMPSPAFGSASAFLPAFLAASTSALTGAIV